MTVRNLPFKSEDIPRVRNLLCRIYAATGHPFYTMDLPNWERLCTIPDGISHKQHIHLWESTENGKCTLLGIAFYHSGRGEFSCQALPDHSALLEAMIDWVGRQHWTNLSEGVDRRPIKCTVGQSNMAQREALSRRAYVELETGTVFRQRSLDQPVTELTPPNGYRVRDMFQAADEVLLARADIENRVFSRSLTAEFVRRLLNSSIYKPELDLMMLTTDGTASAFCTAWFDQENQVGFFEPIGTLEVHRQRGLAQVLMNEGFRRLQELGASAVYLGNSNSNTAANRLYETMGMSIFDRESLWQKEF